nr:PREDICTED: uncharacterized protein LOC109036351 [Bemisia tabaci]
MMLFIRVLLCGALFLANASAALKIGASETSTPALIEQIYRPRLINMLQRDSCNDVRGWDLSETHPAYQECKDAATGFNSLPEGVRTRCTYTIRPKCRGFPKKVCSVLIVRSLLNPCRWGLGLQGRTVSLAWCAQPLNLGNNGGNQANQADDADPPAIPGFANIPGFDEVGRK